MPHSIAYDPREHLLEVVIRGTYALDEAVRLLSDTVQAVRRYDCPRVLVDMRDSLSSLDLGDLALAPDAFRFSFRDEPYSATSVRRAVVQNCDPAAACALKNMMEREGQPMGVFGNIEDAKAWLLK